ncbi:hypothetical protein J3U88_33680 [Acanthopleuribacter pedis]|uniref:Integrase catalytic domain-containing protein n=1 Tax=Acanthopleuribacter pedis TaxID=442870 RepID=A0A8J7QC57_9BACT|nr:hypothetical protein [Acanthopleuribacter pedis]
MIFSRRQLEYLLGEYVIHYHEERPHQGLGNRLISGEQGRSQGTIRRQTRLGGLLSFYDRVSG